MALTFSTPPEPAQGSGFYAFGHWIRPYHSPFKTVKEDTVPKLRSIRCRGQNTLDRWVESDVPHIHHILLYVCKSIARIAPSKI
jgi:hypothetical protein